ncbi:GntR family transcriptional regulator [Youhaiella tibetensis]|jgi:DNA-binding FadR family transcriptional regulator|uniref:FadR family transcriptional regulator n=1 Tax=Paradevosia tibetensis TaxID=1447062 RepID=A0A5B9DHT9_9HYPH|nr:FCD domain-containing protein [Youhaiella tibetensis]AKR57745.1 GntR family transcriptional regulator [Devosia sp. H5989]QEE18694.1 FadR family transcriptional regulator [Youhaiella tibetensis]GGF40061.1 GntR family transcriptional regulator [Youhaiella tibetensis]
MHKAPDAEKDETGQILGPAEPRLWSSSKQGTLSAQVINQLRAALFAGRLTPGERLGSEASLALQFGVSRMTMRDALRSLHASGVIDIRVGIKGGIFVAEGNSDRLAETLAIQLKLIGIDAEEVLDSQMAIEVMAAGLAASNADEDDIAMLRGALAEVEGLVDNPEEFTWAAINFHGSVVAASHNRVLIAQFRALSHVLMPLYVRGSSSPEVAQRAMAFQRALIACIEARDPDAARNLVYGRLQFIRSRQLGELANR